MYVIKNVAATGDWRHTLGEGHSTLKAGSGTFVRDSSPWVTHNGAGTCSNCFTFTMQDTMK